MTLRFVLQNPHLDSGMGTFSQMIRGPTFIAVARVDKVAPNVLPLLALLVEFPLRIIKRKNPPSLY